jgi:hypothetical protein
MVCTSVVGAVILILGLNGCHRAATKPSQVAARAAMDSATIERLCAHPDSVRAGLAECVLLDQSPSRGQRLERPVQPPPP